MSNDKVRFPSVGCLVEFMQGNLPQLGVVLEEQGGRLRLYTQGKREMALTTARLLPWSGPALGGNLSRHQMDVFMEQISAKRTALAKEVVLEEVWELVQGDVFKASAEWLAGLVWSEPNVDHEAAIARAILQNKTHFRFAPPDFEIFTAEMVEKRVQEANCLRLREAFAGAGAQFFQTLWEISLCKRAKLEAHELPEETLATRLKSMLFARIADPECTEDEALWRLLVKPLPEQPFLPLLLALAWGLVPEHYNFYFARAGYDSGSAWAEPFANDIEKLQIEYKARLPELPAFASEKSQGVQFVSIDPKTSIDRDDAFWVGKDGEGNFQLCIALACPAFVWPFESALDKAVLRRQSSVYLPEGDEHMLVGNFGWQLFGLDQHKERPALVLNIRIDANGEVQSFEPQLVKIEVTKNFCTEEAEQGFGCYARNLCLQDANDGAITVAASDDNHDQAWANFIAGEEGTSTSPVPEQLGEEHPARPFAELFKAARELSLLLQKKRVANGAVVTERSDPEIVLEQHGEETQVLVQESPPAPMTFLAIGEVMILANALLAKWAIDKAVPLFFRTQDVTIPKEFAGVWTEPADISRVIRGLPAASLEIQPKRHAGLGLPAYTSSTAPIRRYLDLLNQGQIVSFLQTCRARLSQEELLSLQPLIVARLDGVMQIQRMRPRYWKLLHLRQQGAKAWWDAVVTEENSHFVGVSLPKLQLFLRGKRNLFGDKITLGQDVCVRIGRVSPLLGEMSLVEAREVE